MSEAECLMSNNLNPVLSSNRYRKTAIKVINNDGDEVQEVFSFY